MVAEQRGRRHCHDFGDVTLTPACLRHHCHAPSPSGRASLPHDHATLIPPVMCPARHASDLPEPAEAQTPNFMHYDTRSRDHVLGQCLPIKIKQSSEDSLHDRGTPKSPMFPTYYHHHYKYYHYHHHYYYHYNRVFMTSIITISKGTIIIITMLSLLSSAFCNLILFSLLCLVPLHLALQFFSLYLPSPSHAVSSRFRNNPVAFSSVALFPKPPPHACSPRCLPPSPSLRNARQCYKQHTINCSLPRPDLMLIQDTFAT